MVADSLIYVSCITGIVSFAITILTLLGVYRDLISTLRTADVQIPIMLGNLRQEIQVEKCFLRQRVWEGDEFNCMPKRLNRIAEGYDTRFDQGRVGSVRSRGSRRGRRKSLEAARGQRSGAFTRLLEVTVKDLWIEFKQVERPFLIRSGMRAEAVEEGDYWGEEDLDPEKGGIVRGRKRRGRRSNGETQSQIAEEAGAEALREKGKQYYQTDFTHRFIWWQRKNTVDRLLQDVQRVQIRRMERDLFECDELVKRLVRRDGGGSPTSSRSGSGSGSGSGTDGAGGPKTATAVRSRAGSMRSVRMPTPAGSRRGSVVGLGPNERAVHERYAVRRRAPSPPHVRTTENEASNTGRRRERRSEPRVEYEIVRPGPAGEYVVEVDRRRGGTRNSYAGSGVRRAERRRSYSRERDR